MENQIHNIFIVLAKQQAKILQVKDDVGKKTRIEKVGQGMGVFHNPKTNSTYITLSLTTHFKRNDQREYFCLVAEIQIKFLDDKLFFELTLDYSDCEQGGGVVFSDEEMFTSLENLYAVIDEKVDYFLSFVISYIDR